MRILVPVKRVVDANMQIRVKADNTGVEDTGIKMAINPFCEIALEEAIKLKEAGKATEVVAVSIGTKESEEVLRSAFAMGADRCVLIVTEDKLEPIDIAKTIATVARHEQPGLIITGKQAIDDDNNQTGQMTSALLGWPQITFASEVNVDGDKLTSKREVDGGMENVEATLPAVITADLRLNEPRYASLPNIMKAKKRTVESATIEQMGVETKSRIKIVKVEEPPKRDAGVKVGDVKELVEKLKNEAKVL
ncbi:MAG: electron transfer flavoprotein subunit beta/FixA family protein [Alphaproteobacteria bacterium]